MNFLERMEFLKDLQKKKGAQPIAVDINSLKSNGSKTSSVLGSAILDLPEEQKSNFISKAVNFHSR